MENFKNIPRSPYGGRQGSNVIFFPSNLQRIPWREKRGGLSPPQRATGPCRPPQGRQASGPARGAGRPSCGRQGGLSSPPRATGSASLYKALLIPSSHLTSKNPKKSRKKRGVRRREAAKLCRIPHLWSTGNFRIE